MLQQLLQQILRQIMYSLSVSGGTTGTGGVTLMVFQVHLQENGARKERYGDTGQLSCHGRR
jgi:hypothetical protein